MTGYFRRRVREALTNPTLQEALDRNADRRMASIKEAYASVPGIEDYRRQASQVRRQICQHLEHYIERFTRNLEANGFQVHRAANASEACRLAVNIAQKHGAQVVAKSKSMVSEEIGLNHAFSQAGMRVVETDLGEFIVQLRNEPPTHIITPAVHLLREDVAATFERELGMPYSPDIATMTAAARSALRKVFLSAQVGISGVNFGVVENGTLCLVTNEGNGRMVTTIPPVHIAVMGLERLVPTFEDLALMLQLLPRSATGQDLTSYVTLINGPRREGECEGPDERHVILVDNGRLATVGTPLAESLHCIRCGACLNACPVFREIGGHAYGSVYPGPIGSVVSPWMFGVGDFGHLAKASTLCGTCLEVCPVEIDLPTLLLRVRHSYAQTTNASSAMRWTMRFYAWVMGSPARYHVAQRMAAWAGRVLPRREGWLRVLPPPLSAWTVSRHFPSFADRPFLARLKGPPSGDQGDFSPKKPEQEDVATQPRSSSQVDVVARFKQALEALGGTFIDCSEEQAPQLVVARLHKLGARSLLAWGRQEPVLDAVLQCVQEAGFEVREPDLPAGGGRLRYERLADLEDAGAGLTGAVAGLADTGTLVVPAGPSRSQLASLLPPVHIALLSAGEIYETMADWLADGGDSTLISASNVSLISGPSRTADIEMTLTIGVHGPGEVIVLCLH
jgi:L-lactate dehydrogenase complex protein LldF